MNAFSILAILVVSAFSKKEARLTLDIVSISDTHGWIYGHRHRPEYGDYGTLVSYIERAKSKALSSPGGAFLAVDAGDMVEGTGLSDLTAIKGTKIFEATSYVDLDLQTIGNHECYYSDTTMYLYKNIDRLFRDRYITTNVYMQDLDVPVSPKRYKYKVLPNGLRVLMFGFLYHSDPYPGVYTIPAKEAITSQEITDVLEEFKYETDMLLLACHIPTFHPDMTEIVTAFRAFYDKISYKIPIVIIAGHYHQIHNEYCLGGADKQCFIVEAGCYLRFMQHVTYELEETTYINEGKEYRGYQFSAINYFKPQNFTVANLASRFNLSEQDFTTDNGADLTGIVRSWVNSMNITATIGSNKHHYSMFKNATSRDSFFNLWLNGAIPAVFYPTRKTSCVPFPTISSGTVRYDIFPGNITLDDCIAAQPSWQTISTIRGLSAKQMACMFSVKNDIKYATPPSFGNTNWTVPTLWNYQTPEDPLTLDDAKCYDLLSAFETVKGFLKLLEEGGECYEQDVGPYSITPYYDQHGQIIKAMAVLPKYVTMYMVNLSIYAPYVQGFEYQYADKKFMMTIGLGCTVVYGVLLVVGFLSFCIKSFSRRKYSSPALEKPKFIGETIEPNLDDSSTS